MCVWGGVWGELSYHQACPCEIVHCDPLTSNGIILQVTITFLIIRHDILLCMTEIELIASN